MAKDFSRRVVSAARGAASTSGFANDFVHLSGTLTNASVTDKGGYSLIRVIFGTKLASGLATLKVGQDVLSQIDTTAGSGDIAFGCYLYDALTVSTDGACDVTFIVSKNVGK